MRDKSKREPLKLDTLKPYDPPVIMTTAATPQDSPNTTIGNDMSFPNWDSSNLELDKASVIMTMPPSHFRLIINRPRQHPN